ncbi:Heat shock transcription factor, variant 2 [Entomophthora muscae]|nr:Heat shock transcription factor, variant 2 [Entomophthora muscae]
MSSFVRQLNLYGFTKIQNLRQGVLNSGADSEKYKFMHPKFQRGRPELLGQVKRKLPDGSKELNRFETPISDLSHIFSELESIKKNQRSIKEQLKDFQSTNDELSKTIQQVLLKYHEQNDVINMIRRFLGLFFADKPLEKLPRKQHLLLERPGDEDSYTPMSTSEQAASLQKLIFDLGNSHPANPNDLWLNPNQSIHLPDYTNQGTGAQQGALVPMPSSPASLAQLARLAGATQNANANINNLRRVTDSIDNSIATTQDFLSDKATQDQAKSLAASAPQFLSPYMGSQSNPFNDYAPLFYDLGQYGFHHNTVASASGTTDPLAAFEQASDTLGLGTPANGDDLLATLNSQLPFNEEVSEIITEPHPAHSSTPGSSGSATIFGPQDLS